MNILRLFARRRPAEREGLNAPPHERFEIVLSGSGGQGMILAGLIFAKAASIYDGNEAVMTQSYGPEARGGASRAEVIISSGKIDYPKVMRIDALLAMTQEALDKYGPLLGPEGLLVVDETFVKSVPSGRRAVFRAPFTSTAVSLLAAPIVANVIALGSMAAIIKTVSREALIRAVLDDVPEKAIVPDRVAVDIGFKLVKDSGFRWERRGVAV